MSHLSDVQFHGTTPESAAKIEKGGFKVGKQANGWSSGRGVYLHDSERQVRQYGSTTVAAQVADHVEIHPNPWHDEEAMHLAGQLRAKRPGTDLTDHLHVAMTMMGYHGHHDPDDGSTVVYDPKNVHYLTHY